MDKLNIGNRKFDIIDLNKLLISYLFRVSHCIYRITNIICDLCNTITYLLNINLQTSNFIGFGRYFGEIQPINFKTFVFSKGHVKSKKVPAALNNAANMGFGLPVLTKY